MPNTQEKVFNTELAKVLRTKHPDWRDGIGVEQTGVIAENPGLCPDIIIQNTGGIPVIVETEYDPATTVEADAQKYFGKLFAKGDEPVEQSIAVQIPKPLRTANQNDLANLIRKSEFEFCIFSFESKQPLRWPEQGWIKGSIDDLATCIELTALSENRIARGMEILETGISQATNILRDPAADIPDALEAIAQELHQQDGTQTSRMAMAIIANALTFHLAIEGKAGIKKLKNLHGGILGELQDSELLNAWRYILNEVNYWPIFYIASAILREIPFKVARKILKILERVANDLNSLGATSHHDLCGRMFQRLITDRKFLATFYTLPSSAALLAELAVSRLDIDWADKNAVTSLRIADFACGTGALLNAAYAAVLARYRKTGKNDKNIHARMMEKALVGADIMPAATHLTATILSSTHPGVPFQNTSIITLPYGKQAKRDGRYTIALGSLDLIASERTLPLFSTGQERVRGVDGETTNEVKIPDNSFDIVIMNPPFTRPTNHAIATVPVPSFAGLGKSEDEQKAMSETLKKATKPKMAGSGYAGLASNFIDIAHAKIKPGGIIALVIPAAFLQGKSWQNARDLIDRYYTDIAIVSIAAVGHKDYAFSADTGMGEVLLIATRKKDDRKAPSQAVAFEVLPDVFTAPISMTSGHEFGCFVRGNLSNAGYSGIKEAGIALAAEGLQCNELRLPRRSKSMHLPMTTLASLGKRELVHRNLNGKHVGSDGFPKPPFDIAPLSGGIPTYPALWNHNAKRETKIVVQPDMQGRVRHERDKQAEEAWEATASRLHFTLDFTLSSQPLAACLTPEPVIGGRAWPNFLCHEDDWEIPIALWANTTLGLIAFWWHGSRQQMGRAITTISKLPELAILDVTRLTEDQIIQSHYIFDKFKDREFLPANEAWRDKTRQDLDRTILLDLLGLPESVLEPLALLRHQWCAEPSVHGGKKTAPKATPRVI
ncbi:MAG: hypothetical protein GDA55_06730 [Cellvibrionales bacterium]|nr:hypothetical protein [Cellvibrionales bacterium]